MSKPELWGRDRIEDILPRIEGMPDRTAAAARRVVKRADEHIINKSPSGRAAGAIYIAVLATGVRVSQRQIADAAGVTPVTVRNCYTALCDADPGLPAASGERGRYNPPEWVDAIRAEVVGDE